MKLSEILPHLIYEFKTEHDLIHAIDEISEKFTTNRERLGDYLKDPRLVSAYTVFYLSTNIPKLQEVFKWLPVDWKQMLSSCDFIDLGAGPGTFSIAWHEMGEISGDFYQIETSSLMREQAHKLWQGFTQKELKQGNRWQWDVPRSKFLLFGHSANEMSIEVILDYIDKINPDHILFIEPGTKAFFPKMLAVRDYLLSKRYAILFPCPLPEACPMKGTEDWCHQFIQVKQNAEIERLSQMAKKDRSLLPLTVQAYSRSYHGANPPERIVRVLPETKFSHEWQVCRNNVIEQYQIMKRDMSKAESKELGEVLAGTGIETELVKTLEQSKRVKILKVLK